MHLPVAVPIAPALAYEAFFRHGSPAHLRQISRNAAAVASLMGVGLLAAAALASAGDPTRATTAWIGVVGLIAGAMMLVATPRIPLWAMDLQLVGATILLASQARYGGVLHAVLPAVSVALAGSVAVLRTPGVTALWVGALSAGYGSALAFGPDVEDELVRWLGVTALMTASGAFVRWIMVQAADVAVDDRNARVEAEATLAAVGSANDVKRAFLARMSHELRTPLNAVLGFADVLADRLVGPLNDRQAGYVDDIASSGRHLLALVDEVLDITAIERGSVELAIDDVDVATLVADATKLVRVAARDAKVEVVTRVADGVGAMRADHRKLHQVLVNLLGNAVRHTPSGGRIDVGARVDGPDIVIAVRDTGSGIPAADLGRIFERYEQSSAPGGAGIGLALARRFVEAHGGTLAVESTEGIGSTFWVRVPRFGPRTPAVAAGPPASEPVDVTGDDRHDAFLVPGSHAHRRLVARVAVRLGAVVVGVLLLAASGPGTASADVQALTATVCLLVAASLWPPPTVFPAAVAAVILAGVVIGSDASPEPAARWAVYVTVVVSMMTIADHVGGDLRQMLVAERQSRRQAERAHAALAAANAHKQDFLASMSHELRAPLNAVIGFADVLVTELAGPLTDRQREYATDIADSGRHLLALIDDILELARLEAGRVNLDRAPTPVDAVVHGAVAAVEPSARERGIAVGVHVDEGLPLVSADRLRLEEVVRRLLANAVKFTPDGGRVELLAERTGHVVRIAVTDTGIGVTPDQLPHVFEAFHQGDRRLPSHARGGAGLGLAVVRAVVELHGGSVDVRSTPGEGSTFAVELAAAS